MPTKPRDKTNFTLGTFEDLNVIGMPISTLSKVVKGLSSAVAKTCETCKRSMVVTITTNTQPGTRRALDRTQNSLTDFRQCDACWQELQPHIQPIVYDRTGTLQERVLKWMAGGDTGISSVALISTLNGTPNTRYNWSSHPRDNHDFGRCVRALNAFPEFRENIGKMREVSKNWSKFVDNWTELESLYNLDEKSQGPKNLCYQKIVEMLYPKNT